MVNDDNDKWTDDGELPVSSTMPYSSESEQLEEKPKRKVLNNQFNDQKEMSMEELMNSSKYSKRSRHIEEPIKNLTKNDKNISTLSKTDTLTIKTKDNAIDDTKEESTKDELSKENQELKNDLKKFKESLYLKDLTKYIKNLDCTIEQLATDLKKFTDAKSWEAISKGNIDVRRYANYYDVSNTITTAGASNPNDFDSNVYNRERIYQILERNAEILTVTNDVASGGATLFAIISHGGTTGFSGETPIYPQERKVYFNVYELRLRSTTQGLPYRVTEYKIHS